MGRLDIEKLLNEMTLIEKAGLCSGADPWHTKAVERLGIPSILVSDGPHGLRKLKEVTAGFGESVEAVCFPTASALACSFDRDLIYSLGEALGEECQSEEISTLLGPGVNMKRSPLCGRNFEYYSEDPYLAGELAASFVNGVQSKNVGTSLKHFAANNQEYRRLSCSSNVDERTLREIYLTAFETVVKKAQPWTIMCSYNLINNTYSCENSWLLTKVLREEWGYKGLVISDWGAMNNRVKALKAGLEIEMPDSAGITDAEIVEAVINNTLPMEVLDNAVRLILTLVDQYISSKEENPTYDKDLHHEMARQIEGECAVLLKNDGILPLIKENKVAFIGGYAQKPRYQGGGSSHINSFKVSNALKASEEYEVRYAKGFEVDQVEVDDELLKEAIEVAKSVDVAVIFAGLPESFESEGYDRKHMDMPMCQNVLIQEIVKVQPNTVVVLHNGSPITMPWVKEVKAILEVYLGGQGVGEATVDLLYGKVNPSGKLAETFPLRLQDNPSYLNFPGTTRNVNYAEGIYIGYRYYDAKEMEVLFPFGHGLSYTNFEYDKLEVKRFKSGKEIEQEGNDLIQISDQDELEVTVTIKNVGNRAGKEIVQLYVKDVLSSVSRPPYELKGFHKVSLEPGEEKKVTFTLDKRSFAFYHVELQDWYAESGEYLIAIGKSSRNIVLTQNIELKSSVTPELIFDDQTTCEDVNQYYGPEVCYEVFKQYDEDSYREAKQRGEDLSQWKAMVDWLPIHSLRSFGKGKVRNSDIPRVKELLEESYKKQ